MAVVERAAEACVSIAESEADLAVHQADPLSLTGELLIWGFCWRSLVSDPGQSTAWATRMFQPALLQRPRPQTGLHTR